MEGEYTMKSWQFKVIQVLGIVSLILLCKGLDATQWAVFIIVVLAIMCASYGDGLRERAKIYEDIWAEEATGLLTHAIELYLEDHVDELTDGNLSGIIKFKKHMKQRHADVQRQRREILEGGKDETSSN